MFQSIGKIYLMVAILVLGSASAVLRKLTDLGAAHLIDGRNPISFCNVLFVGNLCALIIFLILYKKQWRREVLKSIGKWQWLALTVVAILSSAAIPSLIFRALSLTAVNNVILIGQIDTPLVLALSVIFLGDRINKWVLGGALLAFVGVALTVLVQAPGAANASSGVELGLGEFLILLAAICKAVSNTLSRICLKHVPLGIFNVYRMLVGTVFFFFATILLLEPSHFMDVTSAFVWQWMLFYAAVVVVIGQLAWFKGMSLSTVGEISLASAFNPLAGVCAAFFILGELPTLGQYVGGVVILVGIALNQVGVQRLQAIAPRQQPSSKEISEALGFKGV